MQVALKSALVSVLGCSREGDGFRTPIPGLADRRGRPLGLRVTGGPGLGGRRTDAPQSCLLANRPYDSYDVDALRAEQVPPGIKAVMSARARGMNSQFLRSETVPSALRRGPGHGRTYTRAARGLRYDKYAQRCLDFLYLAAAWIWLKSNLNII